MDTSAPFFVVYATTKLHIVDRAPITIVVLNLVSLLPVLSMDWIYFWISLDIQNLNVDPVKSFNWLDLNWI